MNKIILDDVENITSENLPFDNFFRKTVLISGANGYVPAYFVYVFMYLNKKFDADIKIIALCRNLEHAKERFAEYLEDKNFKLLIQDVCESIHVNEPVDFYIHAASPAGIFARHEDPVNTFLANVKGAENMLSLAVRNRCEGFLFLSSVDVYGKIEGAERLTEDMSGYLDTLNVRNAYSCGKRAAEALCKAYQVKYGIPIYVVRPFQIIGPGPKLGDGRLHIDFIGQILNNHKIVLKSDGTAIRSFMYITDAITAMLYVMLRGTPGEAFNIVDEKCECSVKELADIMAKNVDGGNVEVLFDENMRNSIEVTSALSVVRGDSSKLRKTGFHSKYSLCEGTARMMSYYGISTKNLEK